MVRQAGGAYQHSMRANLRKTAELGEVVVTAFDKAAHYSTDPREVAQLATQAIALMLRSQRRRVTFPPGPSFVAADRL